MQRYYNNIITWAMQNKRTVLLSSVLAFVAGVGILLLVPQLLFPLAERDQFVMDVWLPEGAKIEATDAAVRRIEAVLSQEPLVKEYTSFLGESAPRFYYNVNPQAPAGNYAQILVNTKKGEGNAGAGGAVAAKASRSGPGGQGLCEGAATGPGDGGSGRSAHSGDDIATLETLGGRWKMYFGTRLAPRTFIATGTRTPGRWA
jgi:multidrug efflux pump